MVADNPRGESPKEKQAELIGGIALAPLRKEAPPKSEGDPIKNVPLPHLPTSQRSSRHRTDGCFLGGYSMSVSIRMCLSIRSGCGAGRMYAVRPHFIVRSLKVYPESGAVSE